MDKYQYKELVVALSTESVDSVVARIESLKRRCYDADAFQKGVIGALRDVEERLLPDLEFGEEWHQFCRKVVAAANPVPMVLGHIEKLLEKWIMASGHALKTVLYAECTFRVMEAMAHRLAEERPRSFAVLVILLRDRVLAGTDLPQAARILLIEAFAIAKSSQHWKEWFEAHPIRGLNPVKHIYEKTKEPEASKENKAPVAKPRANPPSKMTVKHDEGHVVRGPAEPVHDPAPAKIETEDGRWEIQMLSKKHIPEQERFPLFNKPLIFGRSKKLCHIVLSSPKTSRQHCKIWLREGDDTPCIMLLSHNYIEINDERITADDLCEGGDGLRTLPLMDSDVIRIGGEAMKIHLVAEKEESKSKPARNSPVKLGVVLPSRLPRPTPVKTASAAATEERAKAKVKGARSSRARHESPTAFPVTGMRRRQAFVGYDDRSGSDNSDVVVESEHYA